ncbi:probable serine/threonine-protein kinase cdc7 [Eupeodes corollae]|uniref:probable serine/threonine-protein kinase cdc7 n=1 Tax=Eupeodes corollae TaxID=290404 RepID=UPI0024935DED|nr:probable serine/threonine-protein kinase cdc7 [Eupeodes corollae]
MSFNNFNYMDGVPVKISEKYKPPPKVTIPQAVVNRLSNITEDQYESPEFTYNFQLEKQVIKKLAEWRKVREVERENRRERIRIYELQKCRDNEAKQKQLLTAVSYPSAEDLSSGSDNEDKEEENNKVNDKAPVADVVTTNNADQSNHHSRQSYDTILQPTVAIPLSSSYSTYSPSTVLIPSKINYSDFENDTSSPFDNIELKTINDLDILAQVLNDTQKHSVSNGELTDTASATATVVEEDSSSNKTPEQSPTVLSENSKGFQPPVAISQCNTSQESNFYYNSMVSQTQALHLQQQQHQTHQHHQYNMMNYETVKHHNNMEPCAADLYFNYNNLPEVSNHNYLYGNYTTPSTQLQIQNSSPVVMSAAVSMADHNNKYNNYPNGTFLNNYNCDSRYGMQSADSGTVCNAFIGNRLEANEIVSKSKSKSVPDILKELKDEIRDSEIRRTRNNSQTMVDQSKRNSADSAQSLPSPNQPSRSSSSSSTSFMKLSPSSQKLAKNISFMGFPLERVSKIAELYGNDDKKIIEHLIPLSELLDLGFDESKISEALIKFDNNKDKALDFLIS